MKLSFFNPVPNLPLYLKGLYAMATLADQIAALDVKVDALSATVAALPAAVPVDLSAVLFAIADVKAQLTPTAEQETHIPSAPLPTE